MIIGIFMFNPKENIKLFPVVMTFIYRAFTVYFMQTFVQTLPFRWH